MKKSDELYTLRNKAIDQVIIAFSLIGIVSTMLLIRTIIQNPTVNLYYIRVALDVIFWIVALTRKKFHINSKVLILITLNLVIFIVGLKLTGALTPIKFRIITIPIILAFVVKPKYAIASLVAFLTVYFLFAWLYSSNILDYSIGPDYFNSSLIWFVDSLTIILTSIAFIYVGYHFSTSLFQYNKKIKDQNIELAEKEKKYRRLFESSNDAIFIMKNRRVIDLNQNTLKLFKCDENYLIGHHPCEFSPKTQPDGELSDTLAEVYFTNVSKGNPTVFDWQHICPNGDLFDVSVSISLMEMDGDNYVQAVLRDITQKKKIEKELESHRNHLEKLVREKTEDIETINEELRASNEELFEKNDIIHNQNKELKATVQHLKETQAQLIESEKMASLGVLTAGVAHEINNPLNYIMGAYVGLDNFFKENHFNEKNIELYLSSIKEGIERTSAIVRGLNQFSRDNSLHNENCDIHSILDNCLAMLYNQLKNKVEVEKKYDTETLFVKGNIGKLHQVFVNILTNAKYAIKNEGVIKITTKREKKSITIIIEDNGCGIDEAHIKQIMDPFFTTKPPGEGTGLGLSTSYAIIKEHKGKILFESEVNEGTKAIIQFPTV